MQRVYAEARRHVFAVVTCFFLLAVVPVHAAAAQGSIRSDKVSRVVLRNAGLQGLRVQVRVGPYDDCVKNTLWGTKTLAGGRSWGVTSSQPFCWRRQTNPGSTDVVWSTWVRRSVPPGEVQRESM